MNPSAYSRPMSITHRLLFVFLLLPGAIATGADADQFLRKPYVQLATDSSIHVVWRNYGNIAPVVKYGTTPEALENTVPANQISERMPQNDETPEPKIDQGGTRIGAPLHSAPDGAAQYEAKITGLEPESRYYYAIYNGAKRLTPVSESYRFKTHPVPGTDRPVYFWVVGDSGTGGRAQADVHDAMIAHNKKLGLELDLYLHVGDMAYGSGTDKEFTSRFFKMYEETLRNTVCWAILGNHEGRTSSGETGVGPFYDAYMCPTRAEAGGVPSGKETYYSFDFGNVHFIGLNSHDLDRRVTGAMAQWLQSDLEKTTANWIVAYWHHPPYTKGSHDSDKERQLIEMREYIMPILEAGGVDLVLTGHSHNYERSMLMDGAYDTPTVAAGVIIDDGDGDPAGDGPYRKSAGLKPNEGTVQIVAGHGGTSLRRKGTCPVMKRIIVEHGSVLATANGNRLDVTMLNYAGEVRDTFRIVKEGEVTVTRIENPWQHPKPPPGKKQRNKGQAMPENVVEIIPRKGEWKYLAGSHPNGKWTSLNYDDSGWRRGLAGFGYGDKDDTTQLNQMRKNFSTVYLRRPFNLPSKDVFHQIGLGMRFDDAFIVFVNGHEALRVDVDSGSGKSAKGFKVNEAEDDHAFFSLQHVAEHFKIGRNVIAIEGHNANLDSSDFTLDPFLLRDPTK